MGDTSAHKTIKTPSLVESVREHLIEDIMERRYLPGQKLPVVEVARRYGVSETPVKQAFNRLVSEGMLEAIPRRGVVVRHVSREESRELMEARQMVYVATAGAAIGVPDGDRPGMRDRLEQNLEEHRILLQEVSDRISIEVYLRYVAIDRAYHSIYVECAGNRIIERFFHQLANQSYGYVSLSERMADRVRQAYKDHLAIFETWWAKNEQAMIAALKEHKEGAIRTLDAIFAKERT